MNYDKTKEYEEYVKPQLVGLKKLCIKHHLPFFFATCVKNDDKESIYEKEMYSGLARGLDLTEDFFPDFVKVTLGFKTTMPRETLCFVPEDINTEFVKRLEQDDD